MDEVAPKLAAIEARYSDASIAKIDGVSVDPGIGWTLAFPFNYSGHPAASVPAGLADARLPVGLQIVGRFHDDATVLRAAAAFEAVAPWRDRRPPYPG